MHTDSHLELKKKLELEKKNTKNESKTLVRLHEIKFGKKASTGV